MEVPQIPPDSMFFEGEYFIYPDGDMQLIKSSSYLERFMIASVAEVQWLQKLEQIESENSWSNIIKNEKWNEILEIAQKWREFGQSLREENE
jgi:hypothetical protein